MTTAATFALRVTGSGPTRRLHAAGRLVRGAGADAPEWDTTHTGEAEHVLVDLGAVTAIDAGGVGRLLGLRQALARRGSRLTIIAASARVRRVLGLTRLDGILGISPGRPDAVAAGLCRCA